MAGTRRLSERVHCHMTGIRTNRESSVNIRRILVPLDGSTFAEHALPYAMRIAAQAEARLDLVHVHDPHDEPERLEGAEAARSQGEQRARDYLESIGKRLNPISPVPIDVTLLQGRVADCVSDHAQATNIDLIALTTHGRGPLSRFWLGSTTDELIRRTTIPLLVIRPTEDEHDLAHEPPLKKVLIPLDGSAFAEQILEPAASLGTVMNAEYELLRIVRPAYDPGPDPFFSPPLHVPNEEAEALAREYLDQVRDRLSKRVNTRIEMNAYSDANTAQAITDIGNARFDLIALATHGRSGLSRIILGSVADKVIRGAKVPILVYRPTDR